MAFPPSGLVALAALLISCLSLCLVSCVFFLLSFFQCVRFFGLYWHFPPSAWLPCRPFWSLVWETSGRLLLTNKSLFARKDWISSTKYKNTKNVHPNRYILTYVRDFRLTFPGKKGVSWPGKIEYIQVSDNFVIFSKKIETQNANHISWLSLQKQKRKENYDQFWCFMK